MFHVYDVDDLTELQDEDSLGFLECTVANIVSAGARGYVQKLQSLLDSEKELEAVIALIAEEKAALKDEAILNFTQINSRIIIVDYHLLSI